MTQKAELAKANTEENALALPADLLGMMETENAAEENLAAVNNPFFVISTKGNRFRLQGEPVGDGLSFDARIMRLTPVRIFYKDKYDKDNPTPPDCASVGGLYPDSSGRNIQNKDCASCPQNKFGTGKDQEGNPSRGKACKETRRLVLKYPGVSLPCLLSVPPTSLTNFSEYLKKLSSAVPGGLPMWAVTTKFIAAGEEFIVIEVELVDTVQTADEFLALKKERNSEVYLNAEKAFASHEESDLEVTKQVEDDAGDTAF
jgi:hypothetical protein